MSAARPITVVNTPVLHRPCAPVTAFDQGLADLIADMFASMYAAHGVGLAANQIGVDLRVFVIDCPDLDTGERTVAHVVNPTLTLPDPPRELEVRNEGCLSVPGVDASMARSARATVTGYDQEGQPVRIEAHGLVARCLQHECDHLDGILYIDRLPKAQRQSLLASIVLPGEGDGDGDGGDGESDGDSSGRPELG